MAFDKLKKVAKGYQTPATSFSHAAFSADDVEDARRGHPAVSLSAWAPTVGLEYRDREMAGAFIATLPMWDDYLFNVCRGTFPGGRPGQIGHELLEIPLSSSADLEMGGGFYAVRTSYKGGWGELIGVEKAPPNEPFKARSAWLPSTAVHVRASESARLPSITITDSSRLPVLGNPKLDEQGLPGYRFLGSQWIDDELRNRIVAICQPWLAARRDEFLRLRVRFGMVNITVNGYRSDPSDLRHLMDAAAAIADGLATLVPPATGVPFTTVGGPPAPVERGLVQRPISGPTFDFDDVFNRVAVELGMQREDPMFTMALLPRSPIPGLPWGTVVGQPGDARATCRVVWHCQGGRTFGSVRGGIAAVARPGASSVVGGQKYEPTGMWHEVVDGVAYVWNAQRSFGQLESRPLVANGLATLRGAGLADV